QASDAKNRTVASVMTAVEVQPSIVGSLGKVSSPIALGLRTISIMITISGAGSTPLTIAVQKSALIGLIQSDVRAAPASVVAAMTPKNTRARRTFASSVGSSPNISLIA